jgi:uncharacterized protein YceK
MKPFLFVSMMLGLISMMVLSGCGSSSSSPAVKPAAAEVKAVYDQVNNDVNALCSTDVNTGSTATYSYASGTLSVKVTATTGTVFPLTCVYTLTNFVSGSYTISGITTAIVTAPDYWTSTGTLTGSGGDISTIVVDMARNGNPNVMTGTLTVNGYPYDYATGAYK